MSEDDAKKGSKAPPGGKKGGSGRRAAESGSAAREVRARKTPSDKRKLHDMAMDEIFEASPWASGIVERKKTWPGPRYTRPAQSVAVGSSVTKVLAQSSASGSRKTIEELRIKVSMEESRAPGMPEFFNPWGESAGNQTGAAPSPAARPAAPEIRRERGPEYRLAPPASVLRAEARATFRPPLPQPTAAAPDSANPWVTPTAGESAPTPSEPPHAPAALAAEFVNPWMGPTGVAGEPKRDVGSEPSPAPVQPVPAFENPWAGRAAPEPRPAPPRPPVPAAPTSTSPWAEATMPPAVATPPAPPRPPVPAVPGSAGPWTQTTMPPAVATTPAPPRPPVPAVPGSAGPWTETTMPPVAAPESVLAPVTPPAAVTPIPWMRPPEPTQAAAPEEKAAAPDTPVTQQKRNYEEIPVENLFNGIFHVLGDGVDAAVDTGKSAFAKLTHPVGKNVPAGEVPLECATSGIVRAVGDGLDEVVAKGKSAGSAVVSRVMAGTRGFALAGFGLVSGVAGLITGRTIGKKISL